MIDTIPYLTDSIPFFLERKELVRIPETVHPEFGGYFVFHTDSASIFLAQNNALPVEKTAPFLGNMGVALPFPQFELSIIFLLFLASLLLFAFVFSREGSALMGNFKNILSRGNRSVSYKEQITTTEVWGEFFLVMQACLIISIVLFVYLWNNQLLFYAGNTHYYIFAGIFLLLGLFVGIKYLIYRTIGAFFLEKDMQNWIEKYFWILQLLGLVLFIPALFFVYLPEYRHIVLMVFLAVFAVSRLVIAFWVFSIFLKNKIGIIYFIVYLCGVEIAPYLLFYKGAISFVNFVGNIAI